ncbi:MAG: hypothetical protein HN704_07030 [Bacteroidetes bacterium]|jgi:hypothetical protein|nr:hypothetical protein [Bacteroidota bacterium]MBT6686497.1 hypothetical protein [Bacteroidota bacterium]MBT7144244.1 hypothetical protein [Bacteroidota bacterium]MBT7491340.1 hypothetical protein [Bacteroidota bacterium]
MTIRDDNSINIDLYNIERYTTRAEIRNHLLNVMKAENPQTKYRYFVEHLVDENRIYIERPGRLNKGCDFVIYIENHLLYNNSNDKPPKHNFLIDDLRLKKQNLREDEWIILLNAIESIYELNSFKTSYEKIQELPLGGETYELILKLARWFFIEQDITYWSRSGREMLYNAISEV